MKFQWFTLLLIAAFTMTSLSADDVIKKKRKGKQGRNRTMSTLLIKQLSDASLTDDQTEKVKELGKVADQEAKEIQEKFGITHEVQKRKAEVRKSMKDSGLKGRKLFAAIDEKAGLSKEQVKGFQQIKAVQAKLNQSAVALLSAEQKEKLPDQLKRSLRGGKKGGKKKKKKADEA